MMVHEHHHRMARPSKSEPGFADTDDLDRGLARSVADRARAADGGKEVPSGTEGGHVRRPNWMEGEYWDAEDAKAGLIEPEEGEQAFTPDDMLYRARTDRTYRAHPWRPASDVHEGTIVKMPYQD